MTPDQFDATCVQLVESGFTAELERRLSENAVKAFSTLSPTAAERELRVHHGLFTLAGIVPQYIANRCEYHKRTNRRKS